MTAPQEGERESRKSKGAWRKLLQVIFSFIGVRACIALGRVYHQGALFGVLSARLIGGERPLLRLLRGGELPQLQSFASREESNTRDAELATFDGLYGTFVLIFIFSNVRVQWMKSNSCANEITTLKGSEQKTNNVAGDFHLGVMCFNGLIF
jgi:hypothetical protein